MTERERIIQYLITEIGGDREEAERRLEDGDLWLVEPALRFPFATAEEAVEEWRQAAAFARGLTEGFSVAVDGERVLGRATMQSILDLCARTEEALRRAKARADSEA